MEILILFRMILALVALAAAALGRAEPPRILSMSPDHGDSGVDPAIIQLRFEFDQDMSITGASICGGGPRFPKVTGRPRWEGPRALLLPVLLEPEHPYELSINCPAARNTRSAGGVPAEITPLSFRTGAPGAGARAPLIREVNGKAVVALRAAIDRRYSYRDLRVHDWDALVARHRDAMLAAGSRAAFARAAARMLASAGDLHLSIAVGEARFATFGGSIHRNVDAGLLRQLIPDLRALDAATTVGRFDDGIGYLSIGSWPGEEPTLAAAHQALDAFAGAPALIIDVRTNGGGDEIAARRFAARFVNERAVYSRNRYRDGEGGWGPTLDRAIEPSAAAHFDGPVAVLMGRSCVSSCESFLLMMRHGAHATLVGEPSFGSSGNPRPIDLPNGVTLILPSWEDMAPDGTVLEGRGVQPDVPALLGGDPSRDGVLEAALARLRSKAPSP